MIDRLVAERLIPRHLLVYAVEWSQHPLVIADELRVDLLTLKARAEAMAN